MVDSDDVLADPDWEGYENRKITNTLDPLYVLCKNDWERNSIVNILQKYYPSKSRQEINDALEECCKIREGAKERKPFIACIVGKLTSEDEWLEILKNLDLPKLPPKKKRPPKP